MSLPATIASGATGFLPPGVAQMLLVIMVVGVGVVLTISIRAKIARRNDAMPSAREQIDAIKASSIARTEVNAEHASLREIAHKLSAQLDNKAERLEQLIVQAEQRIARLEKLEDAGAHNTKPRPAVADNGDRCDTQRDEEIRHGGPAARRGAEAGPSAKPQATPATARHEAEPPDALRRAIYALADSGRSPSDISRELDEHIGKVELILALRHG